MMGAIETATKMPPGIWTGRADARKVAALQKAKPKSTSNCVAEADPSTCRAIEDRNWNPRLVAMSAKAPKATSPVMNSCRDRGISAPEYAASATTLPSRAGA
jgi:hypothetical protein